MDKHRLKIVRITNGCRNISELGGKRSDFVKPVLALGTNRTLQDVMSGFPAPWASHPCSVYFVLGKKNAKLGIFSQINVESNYSPGFFL